MCFKDKALTTFTSSNSGVALPIVTLEVISEMGQASVRTLFDQGSQRTFILKSLAHKLNLKMVGKCQLKIDGFQSKGRVKTYQIVELKTNIGEKLVVIHALVIDTLPSRINMTGLEQATQELKQIGIKLAEPNPQDYVSDISLLIGSDQYFKFITGSQTYRNINTLTSKLGNIFTPFKG